MTRTGKTAFIAVILVVALASAFVIYLNAPASSTDVDDLKDRNTPTEVDADTVEVAFDPELASSEQRQLTAQDRRRNRVHHIRSRTRPAPLARQAPGCNAILTTDRMYNKHGDVLASIQVKASWCWRNGSITMTDWDRDYNIGDEFWNLYRLREWKEPVGGTRPRYAYHRQGAFLEACWLGQCFLDTDLWVAQTLRRGGSYTAGGKEDV